MMGMGVIMFLFFACVRVCVYVCACVRACGMSGMIVSKQCTIVITILLFVV